MWVYSLAGIWGQSLPEGFEVAAAVLVEVTRHPPPFTQKHKVKGSLLDRRLI